MLINENVFVKNEGLSFSRLFNDDLILLLRKIYFVNNLIILFFFLRKNLIM